MKSIERVKTNRNETLDLFKFVAAFAVVCIHYMFFGVTGEIVKAIARFAVPFFFAVSGYFAYYDDTKKIKKKIKNIFVLYLSSFVLYFIYSAIKHILAGETFVEYLLMYFNKTIIIDFLVLNTTITSAHLWFLPALIYCYLLQLLSKNKVSEKVLFTVTFVLMLIYLTTEEILPIFGIETSKYIFTNVLFRAFPQFALGMFIRKYINVIKESVSKTSMFIILAIGIIETIVSVIMFGNSITYIGSMLNVVAMLLLAVKYENNSYDGRLIKLSGCNTYIYIFHVAIGGTLQTILDYIGIGTELLWINIKPVIVFILSIIFSLIIGSIFDRFLIKNRTQ
ncbi:MAG: acyltransferase [Clostridia bacterium]|nr:acyltransferase [Clostridia bacterium]